MWKMKGKKILPTILHLSTFKKKTLEIQKIVKFVFAFLAAVLRKLQNYYK